MPKPEPLPSPLTPPARPAGWRLVAAAAALGIAALAAGEAQALALGRVTVQSQLGEPLRAEIDLPSLTDAEAATLQLELAGPERYRSARLEYTPWLRDVTLRLQRRPDGRAVVEVRSEHVVTESFVDLVVVARWAGGELQRGYTLLINPPNLRPPVSGVPQVSSVPTETSAPRRLAMPPSDTAGRPAAGAPMQRRPDAQRQAQGKVEAAVADTAPQTAAQDRLTSSKAGPDAEEAQRLAAKRQEQQHVAELECNLRELERLRQRAASATAPAPQGEPAPAASAPAEPPASPPAEPAALAVPAPVTPPAPVPQASPVQAVLQHPWTLPGAAAMAVLLGALVALRMRRRRAAEPAPPAAAEPHAGEAPPTETAKPAMASASDTDAPLDPVAEAEVYLSYGRDAQAEDLLRETLAAKPHRLDARVKLLEILARRGDAAGFETEARALQPLCTADSPEWTRACELGQTLDPDNPLYQRGGPPSGAAAAVAAAAAAAAQPPQPDEGMEPPTQDLALDTVDATPQAGDLALDVDLDLTSELPSVEETVTAAPPPPVTAADDLGLDFELKPPAAPPQAADSVAPTPAAKVPAAPPELVELSLDLPLDAEAVQPPPPPAAAAPQPNHDPLEIRLSLAREFEAIGDVDGARMLAEEVAAEAQGELRERAQAFLAQLG